MILGGKFDCNNALITSLLTKEYLTERPVIFICVNSAFPQLYCLKFSFKLANICRSYEVWLLFSTHSVYTMIFCVQDCLERCIMKCDENDFYIVCLHCNLQRLAERLVGRRPEVTEI